MDSKDNSIDRKELGRLSHEKGYNFEDQVAELYRLQHYKVEHGRIFSGRQVDIFLERKLADLTIYRAIECKSGPVKAEDIDSFVAKLTLVKKEYPSALGTIVSGSTFTDAVTTHAHAVGIQLTLIRDLSAQLFDGQAYVRNLQREIASNERYNAELYIEPYVSQEVDAQPELAFEVIKEWLRDENLRQLTLLGDVGTGKSFLSKMVADRLADAFLKRPLDNPMPVLVDLRNADRQLSLEGLIITHFAKAGISDISFDVFQYALSRGSIVLILDGFDEMAARVTPQVTTRNFNELIRSIKGKAKVILTCRTHYFKSRTEEEEIILGQANNYESDTVKELYWDLISRKGYKIVYLHPFNEQQIESYVAKALPKTSRKALSKIHETYNLLELSHRPMLLNMIVQAIDKIGNEDINQATLYKLFTDVWIERDKWRDVISPGNKLSFLMELAKKLWQEDKSSTHYSDLSNYIKNELSGLATNDQEKLEIDNEIRTASFLTRDKEGNYGFAHKSYQEFFFARYLAKHFQSGNFECLYTKRLTPEIVNFLCCLFKVSTIETSLEEILLSDYKPYVSENALVLLYGVRKYLLLRSGVSGNLSIKMPEGINLEGAQFEQVVFEGIQIERANLRKTNFKEGILINANLSNSDLTGCNFAKASLKNANFLNADLTEGFFSEANLEKANLTNSKLVNTDFSNAFLNISNVQGLNPQNTIFSRAHLSNELVIFLNSINSVSSVKDGRQIQISEREQLWEKLNNLKPKVHKKYRKYCSEYGIDFEDIFSDLLTKIFNDGRRINEYNLLDEGVLTLYINQNFNNRVKDKIKANNRLLPIELLSEELEDGIVTYEQISLIDEMGIYQVNPENQYDISEHRILIKEIIKFIRDTMKPEYFAIFNLYFVEEYKVADISNRLGTTPEKIYAAIRYLRRTIRSNFSNQTNF
jgi:RNA polymerase sigma factor (sigma-70 family)